MEFKDAFSIIHLSGECCVVVEPALVEADFALNRFSAFGVAPEIRIECLAGEVFYLSCPVIDVKDTSLRRRDGLSTP
jgi:hypothetical protein